MTHFHLDHAASLPYLTEKTGFKGRVFCTHPTKAVMRMLLADYIRLVNVHTEDILYDEKVRKLCVESYCWQSRARVLFLFMYVHTTQLFCSPRRQRRVCGCVWVFFCVVLCVLLQCVFEAPTRFFTHA